MINKKFEAYKIQREIKRSGCFYLFKRMGKNQFGELIEQDEDVCLITGIFHQHNSSFLALNVSNDTNVQAKLTQSILCLYDDVLVAGLKINDYTIINNRKYRITALRDIQEWNIVVELDLELVENAIED